MLSVFIKASMKNLFLFVLTFWTTSVFAQTSGDITIDTTQENLYLQQTQHKDIESSRKLKRTKQSFDIYQTHPDWPRVMQATNLLVLSSCESGVEIAIRGEGLIAINRTFFYAGAKNIIFPLWKVNDQYTSDSMIDFYKNYLETKDYSQALRQAKLKMLENPTTANPRFWVPFVLIGNDKKLSR